jgi:hypothetical protein
MQGGLIFLLDWGADEFVPVVACWFTLSVVSLLVSAGKPLRMAKPIRIGLSTMCGLFAAIVGAFSLLMIGLELTQGQPHGPSPLWLGLFLLPFAILAATATRGLRRVPHDSDRER